MKRKREQQNRGEQEHVWIKKNAQTESSNGCVYAYASN